MAVYTPLRSNCELPDLLEARLHVPPQFTY